MMNLIIINKMINKFKKIKLPIKVGLILGGLDLVFWIFFMVSCFFRGASLAEGLMGMMFVHAPASLLLPLFGSTVIGFLKFILPGTAGSLFPQTMFLFIVGVAQYFFVGYLIGKVIVWLRRRLGLAKTESDSITKPSLLKAWFYNLFYIFFTILILNMLMEIVMQYLVDPEFFKFNYPNTRHWLEFGLVIIWLILGYTLVRFNSTVRQNFNRGLLVAAVLFLFIYSAIYFPKILINDIPSTTALENLYARQQAKIFFDNPLERLIIMKTAIAGTDEKTYKVAAYTFFGLQYRLIDIEKVNEYEMRLFLNPAMQKKQDEAQAGAVEILKRIKHPQWARVTYSELIKNNHFNSEKIQSVIPSAKEVNSLFLRTDYNEHEVYLLIYLEDVYTNIMRKDFVFTDREPRPEYIIKTEKIKISKAHIVGFLYGYRIEFEGLPYYIIFDVLSDQEMPVDIDYIWNPDHNIEEDDIEQILKSITDVSAINDF